MATRIQLRRDTGANWSSANTVLAQGEIGLNLTTGQIKIGDGTTAWNSLSYTSASVSLNDLGDVTITSAANGDFLRWNGSAWINDAVNLSTDTVGDYVNTVTASTGVTITGAGGESSSPTFSIGQDVATTASVTFAQVTAPLNGNANTASALQSSRTISLSGDVSGSVSFDGSQNVDISATVQPNSVALGTDTTGNYVNDVVAGTGVTVSHTPGEGSSASIAIGQDVATSASVTFAKIDTGSASVSGQLTAGNADVTGNLHVGSVEPTDYDGTMYMNNGAFNVVSGSAAGINIQTGGTGWLTLYSGGKISSGNTPTVDFANAAFSASTVTTTGDVTVGGNLTVNGTTTTLNTETLAVEDNIVLLNSNVTGAPSANAGIEVERGDSANVVLRWNESTDSWEVTEDGSTYKNIAVGQDVETTSSVSFAAVTAPLIGNADTASQLQTARAISLAGDLSGSVSFSGSADVVLTASVVNSGVSLDEVSDVVITSPEEFQSLTYDGTNWVNNYAPTVTYVRNAEATTLTTGTVVYLFGATGDHASVKRADNDSDTTSSKTIGLVAANIASGQNGPVVTRGYVDGINLSSGYTAGDILWLAEDGGFTTTKPSAPEHLVFIGVVVRATNNGIVYVATQNGYELEELHDVKITSAANNDFLKYNSASGVWVNDQINLGTDTTGNYMTDVVAGAGVVITHTPGEGSTASISLGTVSQTGTNGTAGISFVQSNTIDSYGRITGTVISDVRNATTTEKGIASFDPTQFSVSSGSVSLGLNAVQLGENTYGSYVAIVSGTANQIIVSGSGGENASVALSLPQNIATSSSPTFAQVSASTVSILGTPTNSTDAVTKAYVDNIAAGIDWHTAVVLATTAALPNTPTYSNGSSGSGATLTAGANARLSVDGANATTGDRVLVKNQADATQNGVYDVTEQGSVSVAWVLTRAEDFDGDTGHEIYGGEAVFVTGGTVNIRQGFTVTSAGSGTAGAHEFGTDNVTFTQFTGTAAFTAGSGISQDGNTLNVGTANSGRIVVNADNIDLATVGQTNTTGSNGTSFIQSHTVDSYGRVTGTVTADVQDASTSAKGIARFNSNHFDVSSGSVSLGTLSGDVTVNGSGVTAIGSGVIVNADINSSAAIALSKLESGTNAQIIVSSSAGVPTYRTLSGDVTVNASGVSAISAGVIDNADIGVGAGIALSKLESSTPANKFVMADLATGARYVTLSGDITVDTTGSVSIASGVIVNADINSSAGISLSKLASGASGQVVLGNSLGVPTYTTISGDITISDTGVVAIASGAIVNADINSAAAIAHSKLANATAGQVLLGTTTTGVITATTISGDVTIDGGGVTAIGSGVIVNADINSSAAIALSKLASGTSGQVVLANASGVPTYTTISGDITISNTGVATIAADSVALGTDTTGNYVASLVAGTGITLSASAGEGIAPTISIGQAVSTTSNVTFNDLIVSGNLTVNGTTTTVNSTTVTIDDPIFTLGGDTAPSSDDNKDRGIEFRYHSGTAASVGFMGYDDSTGRFIYLTGATNTSEVFSGTNASVQVGSLQVVGATGSRDGVSIGYDGSTASISFTSIGSDFVEMIANASFRGLRFYAMGGSNSGSMSYSGVDNTFSFSRAIATASLSSASLSSASIVTPYVSGSVQFDTSASVTLPSKTFFPEEYLSVSSSVTLNSTTHRYATLEMTASTGTSVITVPADASDNFPVGSVIQIVRVGAGEVQVTASAGVTVNNALGSRLRAQWSTATLRKRSSNTWLLSGDLKV